MADTKISGLAGAAAFTPSTVQEFPINDAGTSHKVSAAQMAAYFPNGTQGGAWYAQVTADQGTFTAATDLTGLTVTVTPGAAGRRIRVSCQVIISSTVIDDTVNVSIMEGATTLQQIQDAVPVAGAFVTMPGAVILTPTAAAHTYKLNAARIAGTGLLTMRASVTYPAFILVEDLGT